MEKFMKRILMLCLLMAGGTASAQMTVLFRDTISDGQCLYGLYYSYYDWEGHKISESYYALIRDIVSTSSWVTVPATISKGGKTYYIRGIDEGENLGISTNDHNVKSLTFEGDVTVWKSPIKVPGGMFGFNTLRFNGRSYPFEGDISNYFTSTSFNNVTAYLPDKTTTQIADLRDNHVKPWDQFYNVVYSPIHLSLTTNISPCPQTNYNEDVALYSLGNYESFSAAGYDTDRLTLMNYKTPGVYEIDKFQSYVLVARYDKQNVDCHYVRQGYDWSLTNNYNTDFDEFFDVTTDMTLDLTFTWKTNAMNFVQLNGTKNISYAIAGSKPMSGSNAEPIWKLTGAMNGDLLTLTLPANDLALEKIVFKHGSTEQTIPAPQPTDGNYQVQLTVPSDMFSYIYIYWAEPEPYATFNFVRHGGRENSVWMMWDDGGVYDYYIPEGASQTTIPWDQLTTDMQMYIDVLPGETFKVFKDNVDITTQFNNQQNPYEYWLELDKKSASYTVIYEPSTIKNIDFADAAVKAICVDNWDTNEDGELSYDEAAAVASIGVYFKGNTAITSFDELQFFTGLTQLVSEAFYGATNLKSIVLPQSVSNIQTNVFRFCQNLEHIVLPDSMIMINSNSFAGTGIKSIIFPQKGNLQLAYNAFAESKLRSIYIPANVTRIYDYMLSDCDDLISITVDQDNGKYDSREGCNAIIETATNTLIASCKNTVVPSSVTALGNYAFYHNKELKTLELPEGIKTIGNYIMSTCDSLTKVIAHMPEPPTVTTTNFGNMTATCKLYVPKGKVSAYQEAGWTTAIFRGGIFEIEEPGILGDVNGDGQVTIADVTKLVNIILGKE
jgi:hypothetical protein